MIQQTLAKIYYKGLVKDIYTCHKYKYFSTILYIFEQLLECTRSRFIVKVNFTGNI